MTHKIIIMLLIGLFVAAMPGAVFAGYDKGAYDTSEAQRSAESPNTVDADMWPDSGQVETGSVPMERSSPSLIDTHFDPFHPELREIDKAGSAGGE